MFGLGQKCFLFILEMNSQSQLELNLKKFFLKNRNDKSVSDALLRISCFRAGLVSRFLSSHCKRQDKPEFLSRGGITLLKVPEETPVRLAISFHDSPASFN